MIIIFCTSDVFALMAMRSIGAKKIQRGLTVAAEPQLSVLGGMKRMTIIWF